MREAYPNVQASKPPATSTSLSPAGEVRGTATTKAKIAETYQRPAGGGRSTSHKNNGQGVPPARPRQHRRRGARGSQAEREPSGESNQVDAEEARRAHNASRHVCRTAKIAALSESGAHGQASKASNPLVHLARRASNAPTVTIDGFGAAGEEQRSWPSHAHSQRRGNTEPRPRDRSTAGRSATKEREGPADKSQGSGAERAGPPPIIRSAIQARGRHSASSRGAMTRAPQGGISRPDLAATTSRCVKPPAA